MFSQWPGTMTSYWWRMRKPVWGHYKAVGAQKWVKHQRIAKLIRSIGFVGIALALLWAQKNQDDLVKLYTLLAAQVSLPLLILGYHFTHTVVHLVFRENRKSDFNPLDPSLKTRRDCRCGGNHAIMITSEPKLRLPVSPKNAQSLSNTTALTECSPPVPFHSFLTCDYQLLLHWSLGRCFYMRKNTREDYSCSQECMTNAHFYMNARSHGMTDIP